MSIPSNIYAEKVFSEHPIALWPLDDSVDYVGQYFSLPEDYSLVSASLQSVAPDIINAPVLNSEALVVTASSTLSAEIIMPNLFNSLNFDNQTNIFNVSSYFYFLSSAIESVQFRCRYLNESEIEESFITEKFLIESSKIWSFISAQFSLPEYTTEISLDIIFNFSVESSDDIYINGLSVGQNNEDFMSESIGLAPKLLDTLDDIALYYAYGIPATTYGLKNTPGYYISSSKKIYATNSAFPMVYGSDSATKLMHNPEGPSLIIPGYGFLNETGKFKNTTLEFWLSVSPNTNIPTRICGPIKSEDGLYIDGQYLTLKIGDSLSSKFIGSWSRPMLIDIKLNSEVATLLINGEQAISMQYSTESFVTRIDQYPGSSTYGKNQDWIGFYGSNNFENAYIDVIAMYSYIVPDVVAKRRFVYGQGVQFPDIINTSYGGTSAAIDSRVSEYSNSYIYPDIGKWSNGILENLVVNNNILSTIKFEHPKIILKDISYSTWTAASKNANIVSSDPRTFIDLNLGASSGGYIFIDNLNILGQDIKAIYASFKSNSLDKQVLFRIEDEVTGKYFLSLLEGNTISYKLYSSDGNEILGIDNYEHIPGLSFSAGIDISRFSTSYGKEFATFFGSRNRLRLYVGGQADFSNTFSGRIYGVGISTQRNLKKIYSLFKDDGTCINEVDTFEDILSGNVVEVIGGDPSTTFVEFLDGGAPETFFSEKLLDHGPSYGISPRIYLNSFNVYATTSASWQDYIPLKYFAKYTINKLAEKDYSLSYLQFNIDSPIIKNIVDQVVDTKNNSVKTYISFQYNYTGANTLFEDLPYLVPASSSMTIELDENWEYTKYEVLNGTIIQIPKGVPFDKLSLVLHIEIDGISDSTKTISLNSLRVSAQSLNSGSFTKINTSFGVGLFPYKMSGVYYDYDGYNPISIQTEHSPYLYLTASTGISLVGNADADRGIYMQINPNQSDEFKVGAVQMLCRYQKDRFSTTPELISSIKSINNQINIYVVAEDESGLRGRIYATNLRTGLQEVGVSLYKNGRLVSKCIISPKDWSMISIQFANPLDFSEFSGTISINGNLLVNNISTYKLSTLQNAVTSIFRLWSELPTILVSEGISEAVWQDLLEHVPAITWQNVLYIPSIKTYPIDPKIIYKTYTGTNKIIIKDNSTLKLKNYAYIAYKNTSWYTSLVSPV